MSPVQGNVGSKTLPSVGWALLPFPAFSEGGFVSNLPRFPPIIMPSGDLWSGVAPWPGRRNGHDVVLHLRDGLGVEQL